jgi:hypothetical protein
MDPMYMVDTSMKIFLFVFFTMLYVTVTISIALSLTIFPGVPTISLLLAEQLWFTVSTMIYLVTWIICMSVLLSSVAPSPKSTLDEINGDGKSYAYMCCNAFAGCSSSMYYFFIYLAIVHVGLIPVVKLTEYPLMHYIITGMLIIYWQFCQLLLFISRVIVYYETSRSLTEGHYVLLWLNFLVILIASVSATCFVAISYLEFQAESFSYIAIAEYTLFLCWFVSPIFHCIEIDSSRKRNFNKD